MELSFWVLALVVCVLIAAVWVLRVQDTATRTELMDAKRLYQNAHDWYFTADRRFQMLNQLYGELCERVSAAIQDQAAMKAFIKARIEAPKPPPLPAKRKRAKRVAGKAKRKRQAGRRK